MPVAAILAAACLAGADLSPAAETKGDTRPMMRVFMQNLYDAVPFSVDAVEKPADWPRWRQETRAALLKALGLDPFPERTPLNAQVVRIIERQGYAVEKIVFETRPNFFMTANLYRLLDLKGPAPAVLCVHGHTNDGKVSESEQIRAIHYARAGWVAMTVDSTGHGERVRIGHRNTWAIITTGMTLEGVQVWDNMRAVDYLLTRPEVDPKRIGLSGASGGGNQTMYTAAVDERIAVAVPVVSMSTLRGQIFTNNGIGCQCEVVPDLMRYGLENAVVASLIAPRALCQVNDLGDPVFPIQYAREAAKHVQRFYAAVGHPDRFRLAETRARRNPHGYHGLCRREAHQWFDRWFNARTEDVPFSAPDPLLELAEDLFCFRGGRLPEDSATLASLAYELGKQQVAALSVPRTEADRAALRRRIRDEVLGGFPPRVALDQRDSAPVLRENVLQWGTTMVSEPGVTVSATLDRPAAISALTPVVLLVREKPRVEAWTHTAAFLAKGYAVAELDFRPGADDDHVADAALAFGRPLVAMRAYDISRFLDYLETVKTIDPRRVYVWAEGLATLPTLYAMALDERIAGGTLVGLLSTYVAPQPVQHPTWTFARGILKHADLPHLAGLVAPRPLVIANPTGPDLAPLAGAALKEAFAPTRQAYGDAGPLTLLVGDPDQVLKAVNW